MRQVFLVKRLKVIIISHVEHKFVVKFILVNVKKDPNSYQKYFIFTQCSCLNTKMYFHPQLCRKRLKPG